VVFLIKCIFSSLSLSGVLEQEVQVILWKRYPNYCKQCDLQNISENKSSAHVIQALGSISVMREGWTFQR
jgi:hypothetical protein